MLKKINYKVLNTTLHIDKLFPFKLDEFQIKAFEYIDNEFNVLVCAPTGSGKTVVAEYAINKSLEQNKRCFYTTPLKALSNQKYYDFKNQFGHDKVGLLTGDVSIDSNAPILVMTTEVYRNMLYSNLNEPKPTNDLSDVKFVILDECHYMNDPQRGTVWEESIIYSPKSIKLIALSATISNSTELNHWLTMVHGESKLIVTMHRSVPLFYHYFWQKKIYSLMDEKGNINPNVKNYKPPGFESLKVNPSDIINKLNQNKMLPCIYFVFSRRGCEQLMEMTKTENLITEQEAKKIDEELEYYFNLYPNLRSHPHVKFIRNSVASHHAGLSPQWKSLVEKLFQKGLIKVIFATETLALGINMPAKSVVISAISKITDDGRRNLRTSELVQMAGRAGRRGIDTTGHVLILQSPRVSLTQIANIAKSAVEPLKSKFTPSYSMVLNILSRYDIEQAKDLISKSFGQFTIDQEQNSSLDKSLQNEIISLAKPICPDRLGDLNLYRKLKTELKDIEKHKLFEDNENKIYQVKTQLQEMPCYNCPVINPCSIRNERLVKLNKKADKLARLNRLEKNKYSQIFDNLTNILCLKGYISMNKPNELGTMFLNLRGSNELFLSEIALSGILDNLEVPLLAAILVAIVTEDSRKNRQPQYINYKIMAVIQKIEKLAKSIARIQNQFDIAIPIEVNSKYSQMAFDYANGSKLSDLIIGNILEEGDIIRSFRRAIDLSRQYSRIEILPEKLRQSCLDVDYILNRDEIKEDYLT